MLLGFYSSAQCVPVAARVEQLKKFMWITTCISSAVLENRNLKYVFRAQPSGQQFGLMTMDFINQNAKAKLGKEPKDLRVAIIHEDGAYGVDVSKGNEAGAKKAGFNVVLKEGYSATAPDLSALVTKDCRDLRCRSPTASASRNGTWGASVDAVATGQTKGRSSRWRERRSYREARWRRVVCSRAPGRVSLRRCRPCA